MEKYIILRDLAAMPTGEPGIVFEANVAARRNRVPTVEAADLTRAEVSDAARDPTVRAIARTMPIQLIKHFDDPALSTAATDAWGIAAVRADTSPFDGTGVTVAVLDTGIDSGHPAFAGMGAGIVEKDFTGAGNGDTDGHGTHCAGTIFGRDVGGKRIGIARGVQTALIGKVLDTNGGTSDMLFDGMNWAIREGANIISMSLGFDFPGAVKRAQQFGMPVEAAVSDALEAYRANLRMFDQLMQMIDASIAFGRGCLVVAATGNESKRPAFEIALSLPAAANDVIAIGAVAKGNPTHGIAGFSNTFPQLVAPGVDVLSAEANTGGLVSFNGTSMAAPYVAGVAALWWQKRNGAANNGTAAAVRADLIANARTSVFPAGQDASCTGFGMVTAPQ